MTTNEPTRPRGGQPKGERAKTETVRVRFTRAERDRIEAAASAKGSSLSDYVRGVVLRAAARARKKVNH